MDITTEILITSMLITFGLLVLYYERKSSVRFRRKMRAMATYTKPKKLK